MRDTRSDHLEPARRSRVMRVAIFLAALAAASVACGHRAPQMTKEEAIAKGDDFFAKKNYKDAAARYRYAVNRDPRNGDLRLKLAACYRNLQQWAPAVQEAIIASDLMPQSREAQLVAIEGMNGTQRFVDALDRIAPLMKETPDDPRVLVLYGNAKANLMADTYGVFELSEAWRNGRNFEGARLKLRRLTTREDDAAAEAALRRAYELDPKLYSARMSLLSFLWATKRMEEGLPILKAAADEAPDHSFLSRTLGLYYEQHDQYADAEKYLKIAVSHGDRDSSLAYADFLARRGRPDEALAILSPIAASDDPDSGAAMRAAEIELGQGKANSVLQRVDKILAKEPNHPRALRLRALALLANGERALALTVARNAVASDPVSRDARIALGQALVANGDLLHAFEEYSEAWRGNMRDPAVARALSAVALSIDRDAVAAEIAGEGLRLKPDDQALAIILARAQIALGNFKAAETAIAPFASAKSTSPDLLALQGAAAAARGNADGARAAFQKALQMNADSLSALQGLVDLEIKQKQTARIRQQVEQAASRHPREPEYQLLVAQIASAENDSARAERALRAILDVNAGREDAARQLVEVLARQGRLQDAQAVAEKTLEKVPGSTALRIRLGEVFEQQKKPGEAQGQYDRVISENQTAPGTAASDALNLASAKLASLFANQNSNLDQARQLASSAKRYRPADPYFSDTLGWVYVRKDQARMGLPFLEAAVRAEPANQMYHYHLAAAYEQIADFDKARVEIAKALQGNATFAGVDDARALQKSLGR